MKEEIKSESLMQKSWQLDKYWLNSDSFNVNWQALFIAALPLLSNAAAFCFDAQWNTFNAVIAQAVWAILQHFYQLPSDLLKI